MQLFDTHCHIHESGYGVADAISHAQAADVTHLMCVGTDITTSTQAVQFVADLSTAWASIGLHPHDALSQFARISELAQLAGSTPRQKKIVAIGECGLDYFYNHSPKEDQITALRFQIELALKHDLPLIFHVRDAFDAFWPIFDSYQGIRGVVHSFTDTQTHLDALLARGLYVGVNGIITFTKNAWQLDVAKAIPTERLLLETDAPFLTPEPIRGRLNEPANVRLVAEFMARLRNESLEDLAQTTTHNALTLFNLH